jgi:phosphoglycolate phosphatase
MPYKAVLFDLDGTLLDTLEDIADSANRVLAAMHMDVHPVDSYRYFVGDGLLTLVKRILPDDKRNSRTIAEVAEAFRQEYSNNWHVKSRPYNGVDRMLAGLVASGLQLAVLSNKPHDFTRLCVERLLADFSFNPILGQRKGVPKKPDPSGALEAAKLLSIAPEQFLYLGDTSIDMQTAGNAGMCAVGALWGFRTEDELVRSGADHIISTPVELLDLL